MKTTSATLPPFLSSLRAVLLLVCLGGLFVAAPSLLAHPGHPHPEVEIDEFDEFASAFLGAAAHPFTGADHLFVALVAGALAMASRGRTGLLLASAFLGSLAAGFSFGAPAAAAPLASGAAGTALALLGLLSLASARPGTIAKCLLLAAMGFSQGAAHALPAASWPVGAGLLAGTAAVAGIGALASRPVLLKRDRAATAAT